MSLELKNMSDKNLLNETKLLVKKEQEIIGMVLTHLAEIERRKLYCDLKYKSLYDYCIFELGYTGDQAYRRISAMRLARLLPEAKEKIESGVLNLSSANMLSTVIKETSMDKQEQVETLNLINGKTKSETTKILDDIRAKKIANEPLLLDEDKSKKRTVKLTLNISKETLEKLQQLKDLYKADELEEVLEQISTFALAKYEEDLTPKRKTPNEISSTEGTRYIGKVAKFQAYKKTDGKCANCGSTHNLQYDHIRPHSLGGTNHPTNIRLLCSNCNLRKGIITFGPTKMRRDDVDSKSFRPGRIY